MDTTASGVSSIEAEEDGLMGRLLFVTGASRSGTTMLARLFGGHSRILALNETHYFGGLFDPGARADPVSESAAAALAAVVIARHRRGLWASPPTTEENSAAAASIAEISDSARTPFAIFSAVCRYLAAEAGKEIACEQTPRNIFYARELLNRYPGARVIHIVRDPRGVLASQKNRWKLRDLGAEHLPASEMIRNRVNYHPITIGRLWAAANREAVRLEAHPRFRIVRFEDLADAPEAKARELCDFVGVDFEPAMLDLPRWGSSNLAHTADARGVSRDVVDRWGRVLSSSEILVSEAMAGDLMGHFGYTSRTPGSLLVPSALPSLLSYPLHVVAVLAFNPGRALIQLKALYRSRRPTPTV